MATDTTQLKKELAEVNQWIEEERELDDWDCKRMKNLILKKERIINQLYIIDKNYGKD